MVGTSFRPLDGWSLFRDSCRIFAEHRAYQVDGRWITYADLFERVSALSNNFGEILDNCTAEPSQAPKQLTIAAILPNDFPLFELFFVAAGTRAMLLPINMRLSPSEISRILEIADPAMLVVGEEWPNLVEEMKLPDRLEAVVWVGGVQKLSTDRPIYSLAYEAMVATKGVHAQKRNHPPRHPRPGFR
jgi:acyl-CoA synthetase (AMP-forming)/AMP-acid ligase II